MDDIDRVGRRAAEVLTSAVDRRVDIDDALLTMLDTQHSATVVAIRDSRANRRRRALAVAAAAAAAIASVIGVAALVNRQGTSRVVPADETTASEPSPSPPTVVSTAAISVVPTTLAVDPDVAIQQAVVTVDASTLVVDGQTIYSSVIANTHAWYAAVTPSGRVFIGPSDGTTAQISEIVDGQPIATGITSNGDLRSALDERLYSIDWMSNELVVWAQGADGRWTIDSTGHGIGECGFTVQPDVVRCGQAVVSIDPPADAATLEWNGLELTATKAGRAVRWAISLDSKDASVRDCTDDQCQLAWRVGEDVAWDPILDQTPRPDAKLVALLHPNASPTTAWLNCGAGCRVIGVHDGFVYTVGNEPDASGQPSISIRRFSTALVAAEVSHDTSTDAMANWPPAPDDRPTLNDVPLLFPSIRPTSAAPPTRREYADDPASIHRYTQLSLSDATQTTMTIETGLGSPIPAPSGDAVEIAPWDQAVFERTAVGYEVLQLIDPSGYVTIWSHGLDRDQVTAVARSLRARFDGLAGWDVRYLPDGLTPSYEAWALGAASRSVTWSASDGIEAELWVNHGVPGAFLSPSFEGTTIHFADIGGTAGVVYKLEDGRIAVVWSPAPDVVVRFGIRGANENVALRIARSIHVIDQAAWESSGALEMNDGCSSMFC